MNAIPSELQGRPSQSKAVMDQASTPLDHPVWSALTGAQKHLRQGGLLAHRYHPDVAPFAAVASNDAAAYEALRHLLQPHEEAALLTLHPVTAGENLNVTRAGVVHQMVAMRGPSNRVDSSDVVRLGAADATDMLQLTTRTKPGPFGARTYQMGSYIGIRDRGQLVAMAGERMRFDGHVEISAVCVDGEYRGKGFAARLMNILRGEIELRAEVPFLHVFSDNTNAIRLYEHLGFELRRVFHLTRLRRVL